MGNSIRIKLVNQIQNVNEAFILHDMFLHLINMNCEYFKRLQKRRILTHLALCIYEEISNIDVVNSRSINESF